METATVISASLGALLIAITGYTVYLSFGPPSNELKDPFDDHED